MSAQIPFGKPPRPIEAQETNEAERARRYQRSTVVAGKYRLEELIRHETIGDVWAGTQRKLGLPVNVRIFHPAQTLEWFENELAAAAFEDRLVHVANTLAKLSHPSIERVLDCAVTEAGDPYIATERLHGEDLRGLLARERRVAPEEALALLLPILDGLDAAHERGLVHGDLRPESIFLAHIDEHVEPKLCDLGMVLAADELGGRTVPYAAPEILRGRTPDALSDLYSLSMVLYEMLGGSVPIATSVDESVIRKLPLESEASKIRPELLQGVDGDLAAILQRGLTRSRSDRWSSASDMGEAIAVWLVGRGVEEDCEGVSLFAKWLRHGATQLQSLEVPEGAVASFPPPEPTALVPAPVPAAPIAAPAVFPRVHAPPTFEADLRTLPVEIPKRSWPGWLALLGVLAIIGLGVGLFVSVLVRTPAGVNAVASVARANLEHQVVGFDINSKVKVPPVPAPVPTTEPSISPTANAPPEKASGAPEKANTPPPTKPKPAKPAARPLPPTKFPPPPPAAAPKPVPLPPKLETPLPSAPEEENPL